MKNYTKYLLVASVMASLVLPTMAIAATFNNDSQDRATLRVTNASNNPSTNQNWGTSVSATGGNVVNFAIYYHNTSNEIARNVRVSISSPGDTARNSHTLTATVRADNTPTVSGSATVSISGGAEALNFLGVTWRPNQTVWGEQSLPNGQSDSDIFSSGLLLGDISPGWSSQGSVVVGFRVSDNNNNDITPTVDISANPSSIDRGEQSRLTWNSTNADSCHASGGWSGNKSLDGSQYVYPNQTRTYTIVCENGSRTAEDSVTIYVDDNNNNNLSVDLYASPTSINRDGSSVLYWSSSDADYCTASGGWSGSRSTDGSLRVYPNQTTTYYITCYNNGEQKSDGATVYVDDYNNYNLSVDLKSNPQTVNRGSASLLSWTSYSADYCTASGGWSGSKNTSGSEYVYPVSNTSYSLSCYRGNNSGFDSETVYVNDNNYTGNLAVSCSADPASVKTGDSVTFAVAAAGGRAPYSFSWSGAVDGSASVQYRTYSSTGVKTAYVTARDQEGRSVNTSCSVTVGARSTYVPPAKPKPAAPAPAKSCQTITICSDAGNAIDLANQLRFCSANLNNSASGPVNPTPETNNENQLSNLSLFDGSFFSAVLIFFLFAVIIAALVSLVLYLLLRREKGKTE